MEASIVGERPNKILLSQATGSQDELRSTDHGSSSKNQAGCCHFSIRGYVADVQKTNWKLCWPFTELRSYTNLEEHENILPPIPVAEFRWWDCKTCLQKNSTTRNSTDHREVEKVSSCQIQIKETSLDETSTMPSHAPAEDLSFRETLPYRKSVEENLILTANNICESHPSLSGSKGDNQSFHDHPIEEEVLTCRIGYDIPRDDQVQTRVISADDGLWNDQGKGDQGTLQAGCLIISGSKINQVSCILPVSEPVVTEAVVGSYTEKVNGEGASTEKQVHLSTETNTVTQLNKENGFLTSLHKKKGPSSKVSNCILRDGCQDLALICTNGKSEESTEKDSTKRTEISINHMSFPNKKSSHKKAQKMRALDDILKSNMLGIAKKDPDSRREYAAQRNANHSKADALKEKHASKHQKHNLALQNEKIKSKKRQMMPEIEDEGFPLMHWLNRMPGKVKAMKLDGEIRCFTSENLLPNTTGSIPSRKLMESGVKIREHVGRDKEIMRGKKQDRVSKGEAVQQDLVSVRKGSLVDKVSLKDVSSRISVSNSAGDVLGKRHGNPEFVGHHRPHKKGSMSQKQKLIHQDEDGVNPPIHGTKIPSSFLDFISEHNLSARTFQDLDDTFRTEKGGGTKTCQKVSTKSTPLLSTQMSGPTVVDDVPVEILKLLQENWLKRRLPVNEQSSQSVVVLSDKNTEIKDGKPMKVRSSIRDKSVSTSSKVWNVQNPECNSSGTGFEMSPSLKIQAGQCSLSKSVGSDAGLSGKAIGTYCQELNHKWKNNISRSHYQQSCDFHGYTEPSHVREPRNGKVTLPLIDSLENYDPQNRRMATQNADLYEERDALGHGLSCNYPLVRSYLVSPLMPHETLYSSEAPYDNNFMDRPHQNALPQRKLNNMVLEKHSSGTNSTLHMQKRDIIVANRSRDHLHANDKSSLGATNEYNARNPSFDLYKNDKFSAMNLLRLMDQAVCSTQPTCSSMDIIPRGFPKNYDFSYSDRQKEFSEKTSLRTNHPFMNLTAKESLARSCYSEIPSNLSHHVPISGDPGTSFPWNSAYSGNYSPNARNKDMYCGEAQLFPEVARGKEKQSISHLASQMREGESYQNFVHRYQNLHDNYLPLMNYDSSRTEFSPSDEAMEVQKRTDAAGVCVLNRNPADFTVANDSNEYMRHLDDIRPKNASLQENRLPLIYPNIQRQKKAMKLTALKGLLRN